jgi:glycine cleavage system H protein
VKSRRNEEFGRYEMIIFLTFLIGGTFLALYFIIRRIDPAEEINAVDSTSLRIKIHDEFMKLLKSGKLVIPMGLFISNGHVWYKAIRGGGIKVGIDDFPLKLLGDIDKIQLNTPGESLNKRGSMCIIKKKRKKLKFLSPIEGTITDVNRELIKNANVIKEDPYEKGWLYIIKPDVDITHLKEEMATDIPMQDWFEKEIEKLTDFITREFPSRCRLEEMVKNDKILSEGILQRMDRYAWHKFQEIFLR